jgi:hypothetical protein
MYIECKKLSEMNLGPDKNSVPVNLSEDAIKRYLLNLVRNDYIFAVASERHGGITVYYETLQNPSTFMDVLENVGIDISIDKNQGTIERPLVKKLPPIPDSTFLS